jgi:hypothetical protein
LIPCVEAYKTKAKERETRVPRLLIGGRDKIRTTIQHPELLASSVRNPSKEHAMKILDGAAKENEPT